jgi:hypothetical protein
MDQIHAFLSKRYVNYAAQALNFKSDKTAEQCLSPFSETMQTAQISKAGLTVSLANYAGAREGS